MYPDEILDAIVESRGIKDYDHFIRPNIDDLLPYEDLFNINKAAGIVVDGINNNKKFGVLFDVDADGISSGTIITRYLLNFVDDVKTWINHGKVHGLYNIDWCCDCDIVIVVDSLNSDISNYISLYHSGIQVIVLDHHAIDPNIPYDDYITLVSSQRDYKNPHLSGAGVVWKFCKYLDDKLECFYADDYVDLAAVGILADVSSVGEDSYENRYIVYQGLTHQNNPAIKKIVGGYDFNSKSVLFSIAPLINACCRCGDNNVAMKMFLTDDNKELLAYKKKLESYKELQNAEVDNLLPSVYKQIEEQKNEPVVYVVIDTNYGISGLLGNRILEEINKPLFIISAEDEYNLYGSMRSIGYGDFRSLCNSIGPARLFGHEEASGFECDKNKFDEFLNEIRNKISKMEQSTSSDFEVDAEIEIGDLNRELMNEVKKINFVSGNNFKPLTFKITVDNYEISNFKQGKHLVVRSNDDVIFIFWNWTGSYDEMEESSIMCENLSVFGNLEDGFIGRKYQMKLIFHDYEVG